MLTEPDWPLLPEAILLVVNEDRASVSFLQRKLAIGYNAAARLMEEMEARGVVSKPCEFGKRNVLWEGPIEAAAPAASSPAVTISAGGASVTTMLEDLTDIGRRLSAADRKRRKVPPLKNTPEDQAVDDQGAEELAAFRAAFGGHMHDWRDHNDPKALGAAARALVNVSKGYGSLIERLRKAADEIEALQSIAGGKDHA